MLIIPAVDLKDGQCVRLYKGDYSKVTVFSDDPVQMAQNWTRMGGAYLHLVDLDGAAAGHVRNLETVKNIVQAVDVPCELGGGIRDLETIGTLLDLGLDRVILGTVALENRQLVEEACQRWPGKIVVGIDARDGMVATRGWLQTSSVHALDLARDMVSIGVSRIIYTDIDRDGTMTQPNYTEMAEMARSVTVPVIASGGVARLAHIEGLLDTGVEGVIVGRALYDGALDLPEALHVAKGRPLC